MLLLLLLLGPSSTWGKYEAGTIVTSEKWAFIARFCFLSQEGQFEYSITYDKSYATQNLLLYYDSDTQWPAVYKTNKTCQQKEAVLNRRLNQIIPLDQDDYGSGCQERKTNTSVVVSCHQARRFHSARERWWFLAVSNCNSTKGLNLEYRFLMTNGPPGDYWHEHFSADEFYILPVLLAFCVVYMLLVLAVIMCSMELKSRQLLHSSYKLFALSVYLQQFGIFLTIVAYIRYASDGIGVPRLKTLARLLESASEVVFLILLLLLAKGYTITRGRLRLASSVKLTIFMCVYIITYASLFVYERLFFDPGEVLYLYESPAGYGLVSLRILAWWMFLYATIFTLKHFPEKGAFYFPFNLIGTMWFVAGPVFIIAANNLIDKWVRESIVCAVQHFIALAGHLLFLVLTVPNKANKNFPYHVRTTQIGIMEVTNGTCGNNTLDHFGHHPYAPGGPTLPNIEAHWPRVPLELFTITSTIHTESALAVPVPHRPRHIRARSTYTPENQVIHPEEVSPMDYTSLEGAVSGFPPDYSEMLPTAPPMYTGPKSVNAVSPAEPLAIEGPLENSNVKPSTSNENPTEETCKLDNGVVASREKAL
ncbi:Rhodopsin-like GPCR transmembrane domain [Nesidiocoris tenuis]|uniref:Rhodopsin-like GPCR transmembrane domain n=1 Tax=Nesidiocoris tenuis TaxID=355587 RepID=A0ABN7AUI2_9HEMI|nr:Rhodopsin-like GPCR transmembrane domain [Nesidiocoris tenuis]